MEASIVFGDAGPTQNAMKAHEILCELSCNFTTSLKDWRDACIKNGLLSADSKDKKILEKTKKQKTWGLINKFYHLILTNMEKKGISISQLAKQLNRSKASVSQLFNKTPNISILKMVEIANEVGVN